VEFPLLPPTGNSLATYVVRPLDAANLCIRSGNRDLRSLPDIKAFKQREEDLIMSEHLKLPGYYIYHQLSHTGTQTSVYRRQFLVSVNKHDKIKLFSLTI
jgi:hypothetical protein